MGDRQGVEPVVQGLAPSDNGSDQFGRHQRCGNAVFVSDAVTDAVPQRLLVTEDESTVGLLDDRAGHPLEAGERPYLGHPGGGRHR